MSECSKGVSRRTVLIAAAGAVPALALMTQGAQAKLAQAAVKYQDKPGPDGKQCNGCNFFQEPNACKQVDGTIAPEGYCILWVKKAG